MLSSSFSTISPVPRFSEYSVTRPASKKSSMSEYLYVAPWGDLLLKRKMMINSTTTGIPI